MTTYAVTGATGGLGGSAVESLISRGVAPADIVAVVRDADKAAALRDAGVTVRVADYLDPAALEQALTGVDRLLLVSSPEVGARVPQHTNVIAAATATGVGLLAYTSILAADTSPIGLAVEHLATERLLAESGLSTILLRNGWYAENYALSLGAAVATGVFAGSAGTAVVAPAARADYADAAALALIAGEGGKVYELAGSEKLTYPDIAAIFSEVSGKQIGYQDLPEAQYRAALIGAGLPEPVAEMLADSDAAAAQGALDSDSTDLPDLLGRPLTPVVDVIRTAA